MSFSSGAVLESSKHAIVGTVFGVGTAVAVDMVGGALNKMVAPNGKISPLSNWGYFAYGAIAAPAIAGAGIYLGFSLMNLVLDSGGDPLVGLFFSVSAYTSSQTAQQGANAVKMAFQYLSGSLVIVGQPQNLTPPPPKAISDLPPTSGGPVTRRLDGPRTMGLFPGIGDASLYTSSCVGCK